MKKVYYHEKIKRGSSDFPASIYCIDESHPKYNMIAHWHNDFEIIRVLKGRLELNLNGNIMAADEGTGVFIPCNIMHSAEPFECEYECIVFSNSIFGAATKCKNTASGLAVVKYFKNPDIDRLFKLFKEKKEGFEFAVVGLIYNLAYDVMRKSKNKEYVNNSEMEKIKPAIKHMEEGYGGRITLEDMAAVCGMSPNYFSKRFKEITGQTPFEYLLAYRVEAACEMLLEGSGNVTDVCYHCGFNDLSYFINVFKKHMGISPKVYAKNYK